MYVNVDENVRFKGDPYAVRFRVFFSYMAGTESSDDDPGEVGEPYDLSCEVMEVVPPTAGEDQDAVIQLALQSFDMRSERVLDLCCRRGEQVSSNERAERKYRRFR